MKSFGRAKKKLDRLMIVATVVLLSYGFYKGFDAFELVLNIMYYSALLITQILNLVEMETITK